MDYHRINHTMDENISIWRYMEMSKFSLLISRKKLWFSRGDLLGDEHEGSYPECMVRNRESKWPTDELNAKIRRGSKEGRKHTYVNCWTKRDPESFAMWEIYTPNATGIAIQSTIGKLANCFIKKPNDLFERLDVGIEPIEYDLDEIDNMPKEDDFVRFQHKLKAYNYEKELRARLTSIPTVEEPRIGIELSLDLNVLLEKIYISHRLGDGLEQFVKDLMEECSIKKEIVKPSFVRTPMY